jgi:alanyl-tRNA synthetase
MSGHEIRKAYLEFMEEKGHVIIPSSALVPENDPTTLFTGSGMQPLVPYLMGETHPMGTRLSDSQKCFRAEDIEEVGDNRHTTFFEMLGNWSLGDYFKDEQLPWIYEFLIDRIKLDPHRFYVSVYEGNEENGIPRDNEAVALWQSLFKKTGISCETAQMGTEEEGAARGMKDGERIFFYGNKNWWSRVGKPENMPVGEIGGPDSEMFYDFGTPHDTKFGTHCHPNCDCGRFLEIGNSVFIQYIKTETGFDLLPKKNVDFGGGLERIAAAANNDADVFKVDLLYTVIQHIEEKTGKKYDDNLQAFRVVTDHMRGTVFMIGDNVLPSNTEQGYFVRRLIRRAIRYADMLGIPEGDLAHIAEIVIREYGTHYPNLIESRDRIITAIKDEETQFRKTLTEGLKRFNKIDVRINANLSKDEAGKPVITQTGVKKIIGATHAYELFTTYGFPIELTEEIAKERGFSVDREGFDAKMAEHRELSRKGAEQKFKGGLADNSEKVVMYHTATHLLLAGLRKELGSDVHQAGSNITGERLRFDFTYPERVSEEVLGKIETYVNDAIKAGASVTIETIPKSEAEADPTIEGSFWERYPDEVKVYTVKDENGNVYSRELCGGPHVENTGSISGTFKIVKEESSSQGVRRIKAVLE